VPHRLAQVERLDRDPLGGGLMRLAVVVDPRREPAQILLEGGRPVLLGPEQQSDQVGDRGEASLAAWAGSRDLAIPPALRQGIPGALVERRPRPRGERVG
jgi:hypothetical protein